MTFTITPDYTREEIGLVKPTRISFNWHPSIFVIHWGGYTNPGYFSVLLEQIAYEMKILRGWQRYHMQTRGWSDIAYNYAVGNSGMIYELRGTHRPGATKYHNDSAIAVVWIGGKGHTISDAAYATMARIMQENPDIPVSYHRAFRQTECPGDTWINWVKNKGYLADIVSAPVVSPTTGEYNMHTLERGDGFDSKGTGALRTAVKAAQAMLADRGFLDANTTDDTCGIDGLFGSGTEAAVIGFQGSVDKLITDGVIGPLTWEALETGRVA